MQALTSQLSTHYVDKYYNVIFQSSDKSDDVIKVPDDRIADFLALLQASGWDVKYIHSSGFNDYLKGEYGLADYQFSEAQLNALDQFSTTWSRNNAARFMLNPTMVNALRMGLSEALSQWTNPELVATGLSAGILGMKGMTRGGVKTNTLVVEDVAVHGNSLKSMRPTWGYKLYSNDGTFLKNGITSRLIPEKRYTKIFMSDKYMETIKFSNRIDAYNWEFNQNITGRGPLNFNNH